MFAPSSLTVLPMFTVPSALNRLSNSECLRNLETALLVVKYLDWCSYLPVMSLFTACKSCQNHSLLTESNQPKIYLIKSACHLVNRSNSCRLSQNKLQETASMSICFLTNIDMSRGPRISGLPLILQSLTTSLSWYHWHSCRKL